MNEVNREGGCAGEKGADGGRGDASIYKPYLHLASLFISNFIMHKLRHTVVKCSSCVKCQAGLFSDIRFEPIQMLPFLHFTRKKRGGEGQEEQESTWLEGWKRRGRRTAGEGLEGIWGNKDKNSETNWGYRRQLRERFCHKLQYRGK